MNQPPTVGRHGLTLAVREHLAAGQPLTRLEALVLYGVANLPAAIKEMRDQGWVVASRWIPYATAVRRINEYAVLQPPANLPVREIQLTEYWVKT
ncbi:MAG TPA: hypothetical protein DCS21_00720 [Gammaproteobacteria bacterium]|nr:hypothetical protein [Gammaproteobacteria bacterium]